MSFNQFYQEKYMRFYGGKPKAVTFSYDDGVRADKKLIEIFNRYGMKGTFNLNSMLFDAQCWNDRLNERDLYETFGECGHEIALHGARHVFLDKVTLCEAIAETLENRKYLEQKFGRIVRGMAYAYNAYNEDIMGAIKLLGVKYARTTRSTHSFALPEKWLEWNPTCHHADPGLPALAQRFLTASPADVNKEREPWLLFVWGHAYEFDRENNWRVIEELCKALSKADDVWFATCGEICDYVEAYKNLVFSADGERAFNPSYMPVWVEIRGKTYRIDAGCEIAFDKWNG